MKKLISIFLFVYLSLLLSYFAQAESFYEDETYKEGVSLYQIKQFPPRTLRGQIIENNSIDLNTIEFSPGEDDLSSVTNNMDIIKVEKANPEKIKVLNFSDKPVIYDNKFRMYKAATFMFLGGMAVSGSIEKSIAGNSAIGKIKDNFQNPVKSLKKGWKSDDNEFLINYVGHPLEFFLLANYLKASGASDKEAFIISQITNFSWEYIVEGSYVSPSPKDLITDTIGSLVGIYVYNKFLSKHSNATFKKLNKLGEKYNMKLSPEVKYNPRTRGMIFAAKLNIKK